MTTLPPFLTELTDGEYKIKVTTLGGNNFAASFVHVGYVSGEGVRQAESSGWLAIWPTPASSDVPEVPDAVYVNMAHVVTIAFAS